MMKKTVRIRRVGSVTFGAVLIVTGILFLVHILLPSFQYFTIFRFWPVVLIMLGIEVLAGTRHKSYEVLDEMGKVVEQDKTVYDVPAILLLIVLTVFSIGMGFLDWCLTVEKLMWY